jgi:hypothetical protein
MNTDWLLPDTHDGAMIIWVQNAWFVAAARSEHAPMVELAFMNAKAASNTACPAGMVAADNTLWLLTKASASGLPVGYQQGMCLCRMPLFHALKILSRYVQLCRFLYFMYSRHAPVLDTGDA